MAARCRSVSLTSGSDSDEDDDDSTKVVTFHCGPTDDADDVIECTSGLQSSAAVISEVALRSESDASGLQLLSDNLL